ARRDGAGGPRLSPAGSRARRPRAGPRCARRRPRAPPPGAPRRGARPRARGRGGRRAPRGAPGRAAGAARGGGRGRPAARGAEGGPGSELVKRLAAWLATLSARERTLVAAAAAAAGLGLVASGVLGVRDDLATLGARVVGHERELAAVRRAAAALRRDGAPAAGEAADTPALLARLEAAATDAVGRERI